jgi:hypothetical protein
MLDRGKIDTRDGSSLYGLAPKRVQVHKLKAPYKEMARSVGFEHVDN